MNLGHTRMTAQGQTSVPAQVRRRFGLGPGAELSWEEVDGQLVLRPIQFTLDDFARLLPAPPPVPVSLEEMETAIADAAREKALGHP
jgi:AbrB family looped-hinge helix DNA binding protein